jgi:hypothetical protein
MVRNDGLDRHGNVLMVPVTKNLAFGITANTSFEPL